MIDLDRVVLYIGIAAVLAVATFNHMHANAAQLPSHVIERAGPSNDAAPEPMAGAAAVDGGC